MKKHLVLLLIFIAFTRFVQAQDLIITIKGEELTGKITEITLNDLVFRPDSLQSLPLTIPKKQVFMVKFGNGTKEIFTRIDPQTNTFATLNAREMYERGRTDAKKLYKGNNTLWGTAATTLFVGLPAPVIIGAIPPKINYQQVSEVSLLQNPHYVRGYKQQAHKKKLGKVAAGAGLGAGVMISIFYAFINSMGH